jgi:hypothetical protein
MCWILIVLGAAMLVFGVFLLVRFAVGRGAASPMVATLNRTQSMVIGALLTSIGFLLLVLGATDAVCIRLGLA